MPYNEAQKRASIKWMAEHTDDLRLRVPKGTKDKWRTYAEAHGMSMTSFVSQRINKIIDNDKEWNKVKE